MLSIDVRVQKKDLVEKFGISHQTLYNYLTFANKLTDFIEAYKIPSLGIQSTRFGLNDYQIWVISKLLELSKIGIHRTRFIQDDGTIKPELVEKISLKEYQKITHIQLIGD
jgi:hypothetical protein